MYIRGLKSECIDAGDEAKVLWDRGDDEVAGAGVPEWLLWYRGETAGGPGAATRIGAAMFQGCLSADRCARELNFSGMKKFSAIIEIIGANPFVSLPVRVLSAVLREAGKDKGPIRVRGTINGDPYRQTLLRYKGAWRLYVNGFM